MTYNIDRLSDSVSGSKYSMTEQQKQNLRPISELCIGTPYSAEYLSLLARQGKIRASKVGRKWHATEGAVQEYITKQVAERKARGELLDVYMKNGSQNIAQKVSVPEVKPSTAVAPEVNNSQTQKIEEVPHLPNKISEKNFSENKTQRGDEVFEQFISRFTKFLDLSIEGHLGFFHRTWRWFKNETKGTMRSGKKLLLAFLALLLFTLLPVEEVFSSVNDAFFFA